jgi:predicted dehydrogenase
LHEEEDTMTHIDRREFLGLTAATGLSLGLGAAARSPNEKVRVGIVGVSRSNYGRAATLKSRGRGAQLAMNFAALPDAEIAYLCDVDQRFLDATCAEVAPKQARAPQAVRDFRKILDDKSVDAVVIATPDHWHAPMALLALAAEKHVYVEKPCCHNAREGELLLEASRKRKLVVQHGTQRRSHASHHEAVEALRKGAIGKVLEARCYYLFNDRPGIGKGRPAPVPEHLDWSLWQGPAPEREYRDNYTPYHWHWFWHWGTAELGNNGIHTLDVARWGLGVDAPVQVSAMGGRLRYDDDQETPDTTMAVFRFAEGPLITWQGRSWGGKSPADVNQQVVFHGDKGTLAISGGGYVVYDPSGAEVLKGTSDSGDGVHLQNFLDSVRGRAKPNAPAEEAVKSTLLSHLGNISYRTGRTIAFDPKEGRIVGDKEAAGMWGREYRPGWEPRA